MISFVHSQIRKTHFPPRPRHRKKRKSKSPKTTAKSTDSHSLRTLSSDDKLDGRLSRNSSDGSEDIGNILTTKLAKQKSVHRHRQSKNAHNSAGDSSCSSSQEMSPDEQQPHLYHSKYLNACPSSQETYCSEIERIVEPNEMPNKKKVIESTYSNSQDSGYVNSEVFSQASSQLSHTNLCVNDVPVMQTSSIMSQASTISLDSQDTIKSGDSGEVDSQMTMSSIGSGKKCSRKRKATKAFSEIISDGSDGSDHEAGQMEKRLKTLTHFDDNSYGMCRICLSQPKNAAFLHNRFIHIYACYKCSVKVWNKRKKCPICNSHVKTVLKFSVY